MFCVRPGVYIEIKYSKCLGVRADVYRDSVNIQNGLVPLQVYTETKHSK